MRISDWSSDVCSSDLPGERLVGSAPLPQHAGVIEAAAKVSAGRRAGIASRGLRHIAPDGPAVFVARAEKVDRLREIGRASCRDRVCQYVSISVRAVSFK